MKMDSLRGAKSHVVDKSNQLIGADFYCFAILFAGKAVMCYNSVIKGAIIMKRVLSSILILVNLLTAVACPRVDSVNSNYTPNPTTGSNSSAEKIQINHSVAEAIATVSSLESNNGTISEENAQDAINTVFSEAVSIETLTDCSKDEYGVYMQTATGLDYVYCPQIDGMDSGNGDLEIITLAPFDGENREIAYNKGLDHDLDALDDVASALETYDADWHFGYDANLDDGEVTLDRILSLNNYSVILWHGHGGYTKKSGYFLCTTILWNTELEERYALTKETAFVYNGKYIGLRPAFFEKSFPDNAFDNAFVYIATCLSGKETSMADAFIRKGAAVVFVNSETIDRGYNLDMMHLISESFLVGPSGSITRKAIDELGSHYSFNTAENWSIEDSLTLAKAKYGSKDPNRLINAAKVYYVSRNGESYGLSHNKWMNGFGRVTTETENPGDEQVLEDGIYHGQFSWEANNCFANGEDRAVPTLSIPKDSQWIIENDYHGELLVESKTILDECETAFASWYVTVDRVAYENGEYCLYTRSVYDGEVLVFRESDNTYYVMTETVIPFTESAQVTDYAICLDYLYDYSKSPNVFSWRDLGAYYNNNFCYDVWAYITVVNGKITAMEFEYLP